MEKKRRFERGIAGLLVLALVLSMVSAVGAPALAAPTELFFSEYIEGSSYNKALEIYNGTGAAVDLGAGVYTIEIYFNGSTSAGTTIALTGTVADGDVFVVADDGSVAAILAETDQTSTSNFFNGDDAVALLKDGVAVDVIGQIGADPGDYWGSGDITTKDHTLRRKGTIEAGDNDGSDVFDPASEWNSYPVDTFDGLGSHSIGAEPDADGDGIPDDIDNCPDTYNPGQEDGDGDGIGDVCDACVDDPENDADSDGVCGDVDNCPYAYNPGQEDSDGDGIGDACEAGQALPLEEGFDDCTLAGWEIVSVDEDTAHTWSCNATYSNIDVNGYGDSAPANEWLITPPLNLDAQDYDTLTFRSYTRYTDSGIPYPQLQVLYSTDYDGGGDPTGATWTALSGITFSPEDSGLWTDSGEVDLSGISGTNVYIAFWYMSSGTGSGTASNWRLDAINIFEREPVSAWVINEILADPDTTLGDANGDGVAHYSDDEFVEIVNSSDADVDISGWTLADGNSVRHTFPSGTVVPAQCAIVVFGGGTPAGTFGCSVIQTASTGALGLNNSGDTVTLSDGSGIVATYSYGGEGGDNQSLTRDPDVTGPDPMVKHSTATGSGGALFSPGTMIDGTQFIGCPTLTLIHDVQGAGPTSPLVGAWVLVEGIVVGDYQRNGESDNGDLQGFHVQEEDADADTDPLTSEGVFVYDGYSPAVDVMVGDLVRVTGKVAEYDGLTEITDVYGITVLSHGNALPAPVSVTLPVNAIAELEMFEGMLVTFPQALVISEYYNYDRYGEIVLTSARQNQPTAVVEPGEDAIALAAENALDRITLDDGQSAQNPDISIHPNGGEFTLDNRFRGGDTVTNATGVIDYTRGLYRIQPTQGADYASVNPRTETPDDVGDSNVTVASFNVLNYFTTIDTGVWICGPSEDMECRGADTEEEFERQRAKIIAALMAMDADVVGLIEIENNITDYPTEDLVAGLNDAMGATTYAYIATGAIGTDAIRQAFIFKPAAVTPVGDYAILDSSVDPRFLDDYNRPALAQTFMDNADGGIFTVAVNHLKSKSSDCNAVEDPDTGDGSGNCNLTRKAAAEALVDWLASDPTSSGDNDYLIIGDLNSYDMEDPIDAVKAGSDDLLGTADDYTDLIYQYLGEFAYSYVFDGQVGYLDHALAGADLLDEVTGATIWHINADEPDLIDYDMSYKSDGQDDLWAPDAYRASDHDPVIAGLDVCDEIAPEAEVTLNKYILWPPRHQYVTVHARVDVSDNFDQDPEVELVSVISSQPDDGLGDGDTPDDIVIVNDFVFKLRAERAGGDEDRIYTIIYTVTDDCGNVTIATATVTVPHDMRR